MTLLQKIKLWLAAAKEIPQKTIGPIFREGKYFLLIYATMPITLEILFKHLPHVIFIGTEGSVSGRLSILRGYSLLKGGLLLMLSSIAYCLFAEVYSGPVFTVSAIFFGLMLLDWLLLRWRVVRGRFGENRFEAEELLAFMVKRDRGGGDPWPKHALRNRVEHDDSALVWSGRAAKAR